MSKNFLRKAMQVFFLLLLFALKSGATEKNDFASTAKSTQEQFSGSLDRCGEIDLTGTHPVTGYSHQSHKKASFQLWCANNSQSETETGTDLYSIRTHRARNSVHLVYIFPFHYFW